MYKNIKIITLFATERKHKTKVFLYFTVEKWQVVHRNPCGTSQSPSICTTFPCCHPCSWLLCLEMKFSLEQISQGIYNLKSPDLLSCAPSICQWLLINFITWPKGEADVFVDFYLFTFILVPSVMQFTTMECCKCLLIIMSKEFLNRFLL